MRSVPSTKSSCETPFSNDYIVSLSPAPLPSAPSPGLILYNREDQSDLVFRVGKPPDVWRIPAHSFILFPASPIFRELFIQNHSNPQIDITDISPDVFQTLLRFVYKHEVYLYSVSGALQLLHAANRYTMLELQNHCLHFLLQNITEHNVLEIITNLRLFPGSFYIHENNLNWRNELMMKCYCLIDSRADSILKSETFEYLDQETVDDIISRDTLEVSSERLVFEAVTRWACQDCKRRCLELRPENQRTVLSKTLYHTRFFQMTVEEFMQGPIQSGILTEDEKVAILSIIRGDNIPTLPETLNNPKLNVKRIRRPQILGPTVKKSKKTDSSPMSDISLASSVRSPVSLPPVKESGKKNTAWKKVRRGMRDFVIILLQLLD